MTSPEEYPETPIVFESLPEGAEYLLPGMSGGRSDEPLDLGLKPGLGKGHQFPAKGDYTGEESREGWDYSSLRYPRDEMGAGWCYGSRYGQPVIVTDGGHMLRVSPYNRCSDRTSYGEQLKLELPGLAALLAALLSGEWSKTGIWEETPDGATTNQEENGEQ